MGFATPGYENSQHTEDQEINDEVTVEPKIFSPDNDGYNDVLSIHFKFENPGYTANIQIFDAQGRLVYQAANSEGYLQLNISNFSKGIYLLEVTEGGNHKIERIVKY